MHPESEEWEMDEDEMEPDGLPERPQRRIPSRRSRRSRSRRTSFGFGHFMLPIVGLVAVGVLVLGIRLFFFPSARVEPAPAGVEQTEASGSTTVGGGNSLPASGEMGETVVAVPEGSPLEKNESAPKAKPASEKPVVKTVPAGAWAEDFAGTEAPPSPPKAEAVKPSPKKGTEPAGKETWGVQVGAFKDRGNAENLIKKLRQEGFAAGLIEAAGGEAALTKVVVQAGDNRPEAEKLAKTLSDKGYPVLIVKTR